MPLNYPKHFIVCPSVVSGKENWAVLASYCYIDNRFFKNLQKITDSSMPRAVLWETMATGLLIKAEVVCVP